jgi:hypothetical protein
MSEEAAEKRPPDPIWLLAEWLRPNDKVERLGNGEKAALRRLDPAAPDQRHLFAFYRVIAMLEERGVAEPFAPKPDIQMLIVNALALAEGRHEARTPFGAALQAADFTENRLAQLMTADRETLIDLGPRVARRLSAAAQGADWRQFAQLARTADLPTEEPAHRDIRIRITQAFQTAAYKAGKKDEA